MSFFATKLYVNKDREAYFKERVIKHQTKHCRLFQ